MVLAGNNLTEAYQHAQRIVEREGMTLIHPYDDPYIIAGQGTIGLEIMEDVPGAEHIVVPVGGGGLIIGIAIAAKSIKEDIRVTGGTGQGGLRLLHFAVVRKAHGDPHSAHHSGRNSREDPRQAHP